jgi:hypothetical protein
MVKLGTTQKHPMYSTGYLSLGSKERYFTAAHGRINATAWPAGGYSHKESVWT